MELNPSKEVIQNLRQELELKKNKLKYFIEQGKDEIIIKHLSDEIESIEIFLNSKFPLHI